MKRKTEKLTCHQVQHSIKEYLMNEMTLEEAEKFAKHVRGCRECRREVEEYYAFSSALMQSDTMDDTGKGDFYMNTASAHCLLSLKRAAICATVCPSSESRRYAAL